MSFLKNDEIFKHFEELMIIVSDRMDEIERKL
jgi:hypothetical protein